jgi:hypothetical protein
MLENNRHQAEQQAKCRHTPIEDELHVPSFKDAF